MDELYNTVYNGRPPLVEGLLYSGTYLFVGAPKLGKSFMMAQIAYHVSTEIPLWGYPVRKGTVLYLALEDDYRRLQERLYRMFGTESTENLHFAVNANQLGRGLHEQLAEFIRQHSDTRLIIIDTLQKVREVCADTYSYANDYDIITQLKHFADSTGICLLLVHHTRKQKSEDSFDMISGTNGLLGAADGAFMLHKEKRTAKPRHWKSRDAISKTKSCTSQEITKLLLGSWNARKRNCGKSRPMFCWNKSRNSLP